MSTHICIDQSLGPRLNNGHIHALELWLTRESHKGLPEWWITVEEVKLLPEVCRTWNELYRATVGSMSVKREDLVHLWLKDEPFD
jgi:hypothetical protein